MAGRCKRILLRLCGKFTNFEFFPVVYSTKSKNSLCARNKSESPEPVFRVHDVHIYGQQ
jgi:hypothetical protein